MNILLEEGKLSQAANFIHNTKVMIAGKGTFCNQMQATILSNAGTSKSKLKITIIVRVVVLEILDCGSCAGP